MTTATMQPPDRKLVLDQLASSETQVLLLVDHLTPAQWHFRESPNRWSIAENLEHLILFEAFIRSAIQRTLEAPPEPQKKSEAATKEPLVLGLATSRDTRFNAREIVRPTNRYSDPLKIIEEFRNTRAQTMAFATETQAPLRDHFFPHIAFGDLDGYQWLLVIAQHTVRHAAQVQQIKADPAFPTA